MDDIEDIAEEIWVLAISVVGEAISIGEVLHSWVGKVVFTEDLWELKDTLGDVFVNLGDQTEQVDSPADFLLLIMLNRWFHVIGWITFSVRGCRGRYLGSLKELSSGSINDRLEEFSNSTSDFDISGEAAIKGYICH